MIRVNFRKCSLLSLIVLGFGCATGCATAVKGVSQTIPVSTFPAGATVQVNGVSHTTPCVVKLSRSKSHSLQISKPGYRSQNVPIARVANGETRGNLAVGGVVGYLVDAATGANYDLVPSTLNIVLEPENESADSAIRQVASALN